MSDGHATPDSAAETPARALADAMAAANRQVAGNPGISPVGAAFIAIKFLDSIGYAVVKRMDTRS